MSCCFFGGGGNHNFCCLSDVFQRQQDPETLLLGRGRSCFVGGMLLVARNASNNLAENQSSLSSSSQSIPEEPSKSPLDVQLSWQAIASLSMLCVFSFCYGLNTLHTGFSVETEIDALALLTQDIYALVSAVI